MIGKIHDPVCLNCQTVESLHGVKRYDRWKGRFVRATKCQEPRYAT